MSKVPRISFSHAGIFVADLRAMEEFYTQVLGLTVTDRGWLGEAELVFTSTDPREHHEMVLVSGRPETLSFNPIHQISFRVDSFATLREFYRRLQKQPVSEIRPVSHGNAVSVYFRDPEGNRIELFIDTPWYADQPLRIPMDMSLSDEQLWQWVEDSARNSPGFKSREQWEAETRRKMGLD